MLLEVEPIENIGGEIASTYMHIFILSTPV